MEVYLPTLKAIRYTGKLPRVLREVVYVRGEKKVTLETGDIAFVPVHTALLMKRKGFNQFDLLTDEEVQALFVSEQKEPIKDDEPIKDELTLENIYNKTDDEIKEECKKRGIKIGRKKRDDLISLLLPFLEKEDTD